VKKDYETCVIARLTPLKEERLKRWRERADYRATLRVINNNGKEFDGAECESHQSSGDEMMEAIFNMDEYLNGIEPIIGSYDEVSKNN
jgi:hypothetical protein